jgi:hypothetical protein
VYKLAVIINTDRGQSQEQYPDITTDIISCSDSESFTFHWLRYYYERFEVSVEVAMKNDVFWDIKPQFLPHSKHITSPLQRQAC